MVEQVQTGGLKKFEWRQKGSELDPERRKAIAEGYAEADARKRKQKIKLTIYWILLILFFLGILIFIFARK